MTVHNIPLANQLDHGQVNTIREGLCAVYEDFVVADRIDRPSYQVSHLVCPGSCPLQMSLVVSTYQAGRVIRRGDGEAQHALSRVRQADGHRRRRDGSPSVEHAWSGANQHAAVAAKLSRSAKRRACLPAHPRAGDIDIHEMAYDRADELWVVNTRFLSVHTRRQPQLHARALRSYRLCSGGSVPQWTGDGGRPAAICDSPGETDTAGGGA